VAQVVVPLADGVGQGAVLFLVAAGLTLIYGVMRILNFSHGGFFMLGAYLAFTIGHGRVPSALVLLPVLVGAGVVTAAVGAVAETVLFRRLYSVPELYSLLGTYALLLTLQGAGQLIWGVHPVSLGQAPELERAVEMGGAGLPLYDLTLIAVGLVVLAGLHLLANRTAFGRMVKATAADRDMAAILGIDVKRVFLAMFCVGIFLAGFAGALIAPVVSITSDISLVYLVESFAIVIVGGLGSVGGSFVAALLLGVLNSFLVALRPELAQFSLYAAMALILLVRPQGLLGRRSEVA
jgi:branched-chain amino acid transport system permease protein